MLERISLTIDKKLLDRIDGIVDGERFKNRSQTIGELLRGALRTKGVEKAFVLAGKKNFLLEKTLAWLAKNGITQAVIASGKDKEVLDRVKDGSKFGLKVEYSWDENKGTSSALEKAKGLLQEPFVVCYSDVFCEELNLKDLFETHEAGKNACTLVLASSNQPRKYGVAKMLGSRITEFEEKPSNAEGFLVNAGVALCNPQVFPFLSNGPSFEKNVLPALARQGQLGGFVYYGKWIH